MGIFASILSKLGIGHDDAATTTTTATTGDASQTPSATGAPPVIEGTAPPSGSPAQSVDVAAHLDELAATNAEKLNWRTSIVDLLKLLGLDSSLASRKELATELHCPADKMGDSAQMNMWLHQTVLAKLAENGGQVPADLLH